MIKSETALEWDSGDIFSQISKLSWTSVPYLYHSKHGYAVPHGSY